jgi:hypothetical protein
MSDDSTTAGAPAPASDADLAAVTGFLDALGPGLEAVVAVGRELPDDQPPRPFSPEWT